MKRDEKHFFTIILFKYVDVIRAESVFVLQLSSTFICIFPPNTFFCFVSVVTRFSFRYAKQLFEDAKMPPESPKHNHTEQTYSYWLECKRETGLIYATDLKKTVRNFLF